MQNMPLTTVTIRIGKKKLLEEQKTKLLTLQDKDKGYWEHIPISATFLIVCLKAQTMESSTSLNCWGGIDNRAEEKQSC